MGERAPGIRAGPGASADAGIYQQAGTAELHQAVGEIDDRGGEGGIPGVYVCEFVDSVSGVFERNLVEEAITGDFEPLRIL